MMVADQANDADLTALLSELADLMVAHPEYCPQIISPERFGNLDYRAITSTERWQTLKVLFERIVNNAGAPVAEIEPTEFQSVAGRIQTSMGDDVRYLDSSAHSEANTADVCRAYSRYFRELIALPDGQGPAFYRHIRFDNASS